MFPVVIIIIILIFIGASQGVQEQRKNAIRDKSINVNQKNKIYFNDLYHIKQFISKIDSSPQGKKMAQEWGDTGTLFMMYMHSMYESTHNLDEREVKISLSREVFFLVEDEQNWDQLSKEASELLGIFNIDYYVLLAKIAIYRGKCMENQVPSVIDEILKWSENSRNTINKLR